MWFEAIVGAIIICITLLGFRLLHWIVEKCDGPVMSKLMELLAGALFINEVRKFMDKDDKED